MEQVNLHKLVSKYLLLDEQAWALCFKSVKYIQTMYGSVIDLNDSYECEAEGVFCNLTLECIELMEDGDISLDLKINNIAAEENLVKPKSTNTSTGDGSRFLDNIGTDDLSSPPVRFRSKFERLRYEAAQAKKKQEADKMKRIPSGALRPAYMKGTDGSKSTSTVMGASPLSTALDASSVLDDTGTGDLPCHPVRFRSKFDRLRYEAQVKPEEEKEPEISGKAEAEVVLALGRMIFQSLRSRSEGDQDPKLYDLLACMTGDLSKRIPLQRISKECQIHANWEGDFRYTCVLRDLVSYYQVFIDKSISLKNLAPNIGRSSKEVDNNDMSDDSSDDNDWSNEEVTSTSPSDSLYDIDVELGNTVSEGQDTNMDDAIMTNILGAYDGQEKNLQPDSVEIKSEGKNLAMAEKNQSGDDNGILSQEELSKEKSEDACSYKIHNDTTMANGIGELVKSHIDADENNMPTKPGEIMSEIINPATFEKKHSDDDIGTFSEVPSEKKKDDMCDKNTPNMQDITFAGTQSGNMAAKSTGNEDEHQNVKQENQEQESTSDCESTDKADKPSMVVNWGNVSEAWRARMTVRQMQDKMGIDQDKEKVPKRNWTKTSSKGKTENTQVEATKPVQVVSTAEEKNEISQDEENAEAGPTDGNVIPPISVNWGDIPEPLSAKLTVQQVKGKMGIKEDIVVRPNRILNKKTETIIGSEDKDESNVNFGQQSQEESAPATIIWGNVPEKWEANLTVHQVQAKMGLKQTMVVSPRRKSAMKKEPEALQRDQSFEQTDERPEENIVHPPITVKWGNEPEQWAAQLNVMQIKKKMGVKEKKVMRPRNLDKTPVEVQIDQNKDPKDIPTCNTPDFQVDGIQDENTVNPPRTVKWGNEPEQWAAQLNLMQIMKMMGIKEEKVTRPNKNWNKNPSPKVHFTDGTCKDIKKGKNTDKADTIETETTNVIGINNGEENGIVLVEAAEATAKAEDKAEIVNDSDKVKTIVTDVTTTTGIETEKTIATTGQKFDKGSNIIEAVEQATTMNYGAVAQKRDVLKSVVFNLPSQGERLKAQIEEIKALLLVKQTRKTKEEVRKLRTEAELLLQLSASNKPKDAGFLKTMLSKVDTYLNPFKWTKATAKPAIDSNLNVEAVRGDLTSKKGWLSSGVRNVLLQAADASIYAGLAYCGFYNVFSMETAFNLLLIYSNLTSEPSVENVVTSTIASQAAGFYFSPVGNGYLCPK